MKYDISEEKIIISQREFVSIARRSVSATASFDEDEPSLSEISAKRLSAIVGEVKEVGISHEFSALGYGFKLILRADGVRGDEIILAGNAASYKADPSREELAELRGEAFLFGFWLAEKEKYPSVKIRLVFISENGLYKEMSERVEISVLKKFFDKCLDSVKKFARPEVERVSERLPSLKGMKFPYENIREGQSEFIRTAYRTLARGGVLYASAPTGTGKTVSALYPALRALGDERVEKVFYLTPKTTTAEAARECLTLMAERGANIRAVILTAKDRCCIGNHACRDARKNCRFAPCKNIGEAALALYNMGLTVVTSREFMRVGEQYGVCPHELSLTYAELSDVVICDFNYLFDPQVYIRRFFTEGGRYAILVDEAHNLCERAREMYSAEITADEIAAPAADEVLGVLSPTKKMADTARAVFEDIFYPFVKEELRENREGEMVGAVNLSEIPARLYTLLDEILTVTDDELRDNLRARDEERDARVKSLRNYYYKIKKFAEAAARFDDAYKLFVFFEDGQIRVRIFCLDTGPAIKKCLGKGHGAVLFSATLSPLGYYRSVLGGERSDEMLEVNSPFAPEQLSVAIMDKISTRYSEREDTLLAVCRAIAATVSAKRGNYMIFSPSFAYSEALSELFRAKYPNIRVLSQKRDMTRSEKEEFLAEFRKDDRSYLIGFCVMGGIYSEGIDLAGDSLIGAVIVGIGMPALSYEREAIAEYYQEKYDEGKQYAYIYPGMNRVFQAAGRVIRREDDRGVIVLIDDRFDDPLYRKSLPKLWEGVQFIGDAKELKEELEEFWRAEENN
ncbi:MAG: ATP-dependent DNA helicase [Ruminococcaceae bacterium]|nr:ATP-dependent DNA helicase [Oscillospiraceae bacterium]